MRHLTQLFTIIITIIETLSGVLPKHITTYRNGISHEAIIFYINLYRDMEKQILPTWVSTLR